MTSNLDRKERRGPSGSKGWTPERRARQAELIRRWRPWRRSTGPKTEAGKARCAMNALKHGCRGRAYLNQASRVRYAIRLSQHTNEIVRLLIRMRSAHPDLKPTYGMLLSAATDRLRQFREMHGVEKIAKLIEQTFESRNSPTRPVACEKVVERPQGWGGSPTTSLGSLERRPVLQSPNGVGGRTEFA